MDEIWNSQRQIIFLGRVILYQSDVHQWISSQAYARWGRRGLQAGEFADLPSAEVDFISWFL